METITDVAIIWHGKQYSLPAPNRHHDVILHIHIITGDTNISGEQGFLTSHGRFVGRLEALDVAQNADQVKHPPHEIRCGMLFSEDIW